MLLRSPRMIWHPQDTSARSVVEALSTEWFLTGYSRERSLMGSGQYNDVDYVEFQPLAVSRKIHPVIACFLAIALGFGSHASKEALAPAESSLSALGVGPIGYAALTVAPIALGLVSPVLWGRLWDYDNRLAFMMAPSGELLGAVLVAGGLRVHANGEGGGKAMVLANALLMFGFLCISASKAGVAIAEFSTVGRLSGRYSAVGFACVILAKHVMGILTSWGVPRVLATTDDEMLGLARVQLILLVPHVLSVLAGVTLAQSRLCDCDEKANEADDEAAGLPPVHERPEVSPRKHMARSLEREEQGERSPPVVPASPYVASALAKLLGLSQATLDVDAEGVAASVASSWYVIALIGLWRALTVGTLHAYHSIRIKFMQSRGLPLTVAGSLFAASDGAGILLLLPLIALLCRVTGLKPMLSITPLLAIAATLTLQLMPGDGVDVRMAIFVLSVLEVLAPIIPLALLPANARKLGAAYGAIEVMFITIQMAIVCLLGVARTVSGYSGALGLIIGGFASVMIISLPVTMVRRRESNSRGASSALDGLVAQHALHPVLAYRLTPNLRSDVTVRATSLDSYNCSTRATSSAMIASTSVTTDSRDLSTQHNITHVHALLNLTVTERQLSSLPHASHLRRWCAERCASSVDWCLVRCTTQYPPAPTVAEIDGWMGGRLRMVMRLARPTRSRLRLAHATQRDVPCACSR